MKPLDVFDLEEGMATIQLVKDHLNEDLEFELSELQQKVCRKKIRQTSAKSFFFFARHVLDFDLMTIETHKKWADDLQKIFYEIFRIMRLKPRGTFKCLSKGTPLIKYGIDDDYNTKPAKLVNQKDFFEEGIKVTLKSGRSFVCTKDHPLKTIEGWSPPREGMRVAVVRTTPNPYNSNSPDEEYVLGALLGDACLRYSTPRLSNPDPEVRSFIEKAGYLVGYEGGIEYNVLGISKWIKELGLQGTSSHTKFIPKKYEGSAHLLRGLFDTDGHVSKRDARIVYTTVSEQLADDVVRNLHYFGIVARKKHYIYPKSEVSPAIAAFQVSIITNDVPLFYKHIGFEIKRKQKRLKKIAKDIEKEVHGVHSNIDTIPNGWKNIIDWKYDEKRKLRYEAGIRIDNKYGHLRKKVREVADFIDNDKLRNIADADIFWDEVLSIEEVGEVEFSAIGSDIENYMTPDGVIHHNTTLYGVSFTLWIWATISKKIRIFYTSSNALLLEEVSDKLTQFLNPDNDSIFQFAFDVERDDAGKYSPKNTGDVFNIKGRSGKGFSLILRTAGGSTVGIHPNLVVVDDPCFVGSTPVLTKEGYKPIKDIEPGEFVLTRKGYNEVILSGITARNVPVETYNINGSRLTMTSNHNIITMGKDKVPVCDLKSDDVIIKYERGKWKSRKLEMLKSSSSMVSSIEDILKASIGHIENISNQVEMFLRINGVFIEQSGFSIREKFQKVIMFIIQKIIIMIIPLVILNLLKERFIIQFIQKRMGKVKKTLPTLKELENKLQNIINLQKEESKEEKFIISNLNIKRIVYIVIKNLKQLIFIGPDKSSVQNHVEGNTDITLREDVYNLTVKDQHEFIANGLLVANCDKDDRESKTIRNKKKNWFDTLTPLVVPFHTDDGNLIEHILYIATIWHGSDLTSSIIKKNKTEELDDEDKWDIEIESLEDGHGNSNYPEFITNKKVKQIKSRITDVFYACQYMNNPLPEGLRVFSINRLHFVRESQLYLTEGNITCFIDPSRGKESSDWPAVIWTHFHDNLLTVIHAFDKEKIELAMLIKLVANQNKIMGVNKLVYEDNGTTLLKENLIETHQKIGHRIMLDSVYHHSNKEERIVSMQPDLYSGFCRFLSDWKTRYPQMMEQITMYPGHDYDDFPDVLEMAISAHKKSHFTFTRYEQCL